MTEDAFLSTVAPGLRHAGERWWTADIPHADIYPDALHSPLRAIEDRSFWFHHRNHIIRSMVSRFPPSGPIVDLGGGNGVVALFLKQSGFPVIVLDPDEAGARAAHRRGLTVIRSAFSGDSFREASLHAVGLFDVIEHIPKDGDFLTACRKILAPGGLAYVTVPGLPALWSADDEFAKHYRRYRLSSLTTILQDAGFDVLASSYFFSLLVAPVFVLRALPTRLGFRRVATAGAALAHHDHTDFIRRLACRAFSFELNLLQAGRRVPIGSSLIAVARKRGH
jgi:SAM-dependent methyltransferase